MEIYKILEQIMSEKNLTVAAVARICGLADGTVRGIIVRKQKSTALDVAFKLSKGLGVSLERLNGMPEPESTLDLTKLTPKEKHVIDLYRDIDEHSAKIVDFVLEAENTRPKEQPREKTRAIDLFDLPVSAGNGVYLDGYSSRPIEIINTPEAARADYALRVSGNSMEPRFYDGDIVLVETTFNIPQKSVGVFIHNGEGFIKQLDGAYMRSFNPAYSPILADSETLIKGLVLGRAELI